MSNKTMTNGAVNGEKSSSLFLSHLTAYPVVSDAVQTYKTNPYGAKTLDIAHFAFDRFAAPFLPYLRTPYSIVAPYLSKADSLADTGLSKVDERFPVVKQDTKEVKGSVVDVVTFPLRVALQGKEYLVHTYGDEYQKTGGSGNLVHTAKALVSTELKVAFDAYGYVSSYFVKGKETAKEKTNQK